MVESSTAAAVDLKKFDADRFVSLFKKVGETPDRIDVDAWVALLHETINLFSLLGSAMSMAFSGKNILVTRHHEYNNTVCRCFIKS